MRILAIETSCDDTALACLEDGVVRASIGANQDAHHQRYGGVVPEIAARVHLDAINPVIDEVLAKAEWTLGEIDLFAVTQGPGLLGSLLIGVTTAKTLAFVTGKPLVAV
ncbi:MAG: tRNA (adenosine(37)-N6)-threonylcarbamoyltransferase complex transferase subunit TsaD, partial [bacterium]